jgi:hypothetical protein
MMLTSSKLYVDVEKRNTIAGKTAKREELACETELRVNSILYSKPSYQNGTLKLGQKFKLTF